MGGNTVLSCTISSHLVNSFDLQSSSLFLFISGDSLNILKSHCISCMCSSTLGVPLLQTSLRCCYGSSLPDCCIGTTYSCLPLGSVPPAPARAMHPRNVPTGGTGELLLHIISKLSRKQQTCMKLFEPFCIVVQRHQPTYKALELRLDRHQTNKIIKLFQFQTGQLRHSRAESHCHTAPVVRF